MNSIALVQAQNWVKQHHCCAFCFPNSEAVFWYGVKNLTISRWVSNVFLHETAKSRKVCGYTGNAHHSTFSCRKKHTKSISGQYALNGFTLREKRKRNRQREGPITLETWEKNVLLWGWLKTWTWLSSDIVKSPPLQMFKTRPGAALSNLLQLTLPWGKRLD